MVAGAAALSLMEGSARRRRNLDALALAALSSDLAATIASHRAYQKRGVGAALETSWGRVEKTGVTGLGTAVPAALQAASLMLGSGRPGTVSDIASLLMLGGSMMLRVSMMQAGNISARRPDISFRFSQPENVP
jgi:formate-dependent nitrite reductase membrane component NrfD